MLGPRFGKFNHGTITPIPGHNLTAATTGCFVLWLGWFGFNPGSTMAADPVAISKICITTNTAAAAAILSATAVSWKLLGKPDLGMTLNGCLAGLVAITAPCAFVSVESAFIIGIIAGAIVVPAVIWFDKVRIDDPVGALSVHLVNGVWGTFSLGLFADDALTGKGLLMGGGTKLVMAQITGIIAVGIFTFIAALITWGIIKATIGMRVSLQEEISGLDIGEHGNSAYPEIISRKPSYTYVGTGSTQE